MKHTSVIDCSLFDLKKIKNRAGNLTIVENFISIPFEVERIYYLYDIPNKAQRGGHAHKELYQLIIAASGSFSISLDDSFKKASFFLNSPDVGLLIVPGIWRDLHDFSSGSVCLVLASMIYNSDDYIREYSDFIKYKINDTFNM